jgi:hypothetical protein
MARLGSKKKRGEKGKTCEAENLGHAWLCQIYPQTAAMDPSPQAHCQR